MNGRRIVVVAYDGIELIDVACVTSGFEHANRLGADPGYDVVLATPVGRPVRSDSGLELRGQDRLDGIIGRIDTLVVSGGLGHETAAANTRLLGQVGRLAASSRRVASVCTGATVLAAAGLLDGRPVTTHWYHARRLAERFPQVYVDAAPSTSVTGWWLRRVASRQPSTSRWPSSRRTTELSWPAGWRWAW